MNRNRRGGFTLIEMLVVIGMIGILTGVLLPSYFYVQGIARQSRAQGLVSNAATALTLYLQREGMWHEDILYAKSNGEFNAAVCKVLFDVGLLDVAQGQTYSLDKFGLLDPWGQAMLKRSKQWLEIKDPNAVPEELRVHLLQFRIDTDLNGKVESADGKATPLDMSVRGSAIVWSRGPSGMDDEKTGGRYPNENRISWSFGK